MGEDHRSDSGFSDLPFHEYCTHCNTRFDATILRPTVTIVETDDERVIHSFCDEECLAGWASDE